MELRPEFGSELYMAQYNACMEAFDQKRQFTYLCDVPVAVRWVPDTLLAYPA